MWLSRRRLGYWAKLGLRRDFIFVSPRHASLLCSPRNPVEHRVQLRAALGMHHRHKRDASQQMTAKVGMAGAVLCCRSVAPAVCQNCFELVIDRAADVKTLIDHDPGELLPDAALHQPALLEMQFEPFLGRDDGDGGLETPGVANQ